MERLEDHRISLVLLLGGIAAYLYLNLFLLPATPVLLSGDQVFFWVNGQRMLHGEIPYLDFFQFTPPGADLFYFVIFKLFGPRIWVLDAVVLCLGVILCWICYRIAIRLMERNLAVLATLLFATLIYSRLLNTTHHWFSVLAIMSAVSILMRGTDAPRLGIAGALLGVATFFTQTHGVVALLAISLFLRDRAAGTQSSQEFWKKERPLLIGFFVALLCCSAYFIVRVGVRKLFYFQIFYVLRVMVHRPETELLGMPGPASLRTLQYLVVYVLLPVSYWLALRRTWRKPHDLTSTQGRVALLAIVGSFLLMELIFSLNWLRLYAVSMAGIILFVWLLSTSSRAQQYLVAAVWIGIVCLAGQSVWSTQRHDYVIAELPAGRCATEPPEYEKLTWVMQHSKPGDFFFDAGWPGVYVPLDLRNPVFLDTAGTMLNPQWALRAIQQLEAKQVRYILWTGQLDYPFNPRHPGTAHIIPLRNYLHSSYQRVRVFPDGDEAWERK